MMWVFAIILYPHATVKTNLPAESILEGRLDGAEVVFTKSYVGETEYVYDYGRSIQRASQSNPPLTYRGTLNSEATVLSGRYEFPATTDEPGDVFELRKVGKTILG